MSINWPKPPSGNGLEAAWLRQLLDSCKRAAIKPGPNYLVLESGTGISLSISPSAPQTPANPFQPYIVTTLHNNEYVSAKVYNWTTKKANGAEISIAKCLTARRPDSETIDGNIVTYTYSPVPTQENIRSASILGIVSQWQVMSPRYVADDGSGTLGSIIFAAQVQGGSGVKDGGGAVINYVEFQPERRWAYQFGQSGSLP